MSKRTIHAALMDTERFWESDDLVRLPGVTNKKLNNIVAMMDELSYIFSKSGDVVLTSVPMNKEHLKYLAYIGYEFDNISFYNDYVCGKEEQFSINSNSIISNYDNANLSVYGVTDEFVKLAQTKDWFFEVPNLNCIKKVNSKKYSTLLAQNLGLCQYSKVISQKEEFEKYANEIFNKNGCVMIKEEFGVSGKGNYKITQQGILNRFIKEVNKQTENGKRVSFIIEPCFNVIKDFSTQLYVDKNGKVDVICTQLVINDKFKYGGSVTIDESFKSQLEEKKYYKTLIDATGQLSKDGYFGDVCIDSMIIESGELVPIVEINARKSMSLIKYNLDSRFNPNNIYNSVFFYVDCTIPKGYEYEKILTVLREKDILYSNEKGMGIIPLSANTLLINANLYGEEKNKGRIYYYGITKGDVTELMTMARNINGG